MQLLGGRTTQHAVALVLAAGIATALAPSSLAGSGGSAAPPFPQLVRIAQLVTLADVTSVRSAGAYVLTIEHVYKGQAPNEIIFAPDDKAVSLSLGSRVLLLQMDRRYLDFRGTFVWVVGSDGRLSDAKVTAVPPMRNVGGAPFVVPPVFKLTYAYGVTASVSLTPRMEMSP